VGSKCHVVETAVRGKVNFITNMIYQQANGHDGNVHDQVTEGNEHLGLKPAKVFVDSNYLSGQLIKEYQDRGQKLMGYMQGYAGREKAFQTEAFQIDIEHGTAVCPAGHQNCSSAVDRSGVLRLYFDRGSCERCQYYHRCVRPQKTTARRRSVSIRPFYQYMRQRRLEQETDGFRDEMRVRAQVEGTISEATRLHGLRHARYRGKAGHQLQFYLTGAAINLRRLAKVLSTPQ
jgi:hypothetical protein